MSELLFSPWVISLELLLVALSAAVVMLVLEVRRLGARVHLLTWATGWVASYADVPHDFIQLYTIYWMESGDDGLFVMRPIPNDEETPSDAS